jgi:6-phosphofructokinase
VLAQSNLASIYAERVRGERAANMEKAVVQRLLIGGDGSFEIVGTLAARHSS